MKLPLLALALLALPACGGPPFTTDAAELTPAESPTASEVDAAPAAPGVDAAPTEDAPPGADAPPAEAAAPQDAPAPPQDAPQDASSPDACPALGCHCVGVTTPGCNVAPGFPYPGPGVCCTWPQR